MDKTSTRYDTTRYDNDIAIQSMRHDTYQQINQVGRLTGKDLTG